MPILNININARLLELLEGTPSGDIRRHIYNPAPRRKLENQVYLCNELIDKGYEPYIEVKYVSRYSSRERRIEVLGIKRNKVILYQFSTHSSFDQDANNLDRLIKEIKNEGSAQTYEFAGEIVMLDSGYELKPLQDAIFNLGLNIIIRQL